MEKKPATFYNVRFGDCDPFGHLNNARYVDYFLNAREDHLKNEYRIDLKEFYQKGISWFVGSHEINYLKPADYNENVRIETTLIDATHDYLLVEMVMTDEHQTHLKSIMQTRFIPVNAKTGKRESHKAEFMEFAKKICVETEILPFSDRVKRILQSFKENRTMS